MAYLDQHTQNLFSATAVRRPADEDSEIIRRKIISKTPAERRNFTLDVGINVDGFRTAKRFIDGLIKRAYDSPNPGGLWLLGDGGVGKTYVLESVFQHHAPYEDDLARHCPVLSLSFDSRPSESAILLSLILQLGQNPATLSYKSNYELTDILVDAIRVCGTRAILFDEANHLWLNTRAQRIKDRIGGRLGDFLKRLYDRLKVVAFIFAGTPGLKDLIEQDSQAATRWSGKLELACFSYDEKFIGLLKSIDEALPMRERADLGSNALSKQIYEATSGNFRLLKRLLAEAVYIAATENARCLTSKHLANAYFIVFCLEDSPFIQ